MSVAEDRFDCQFEEYAMRDVGKEPNVRYIFFVTAAGDECREALVFTTKMAALDDKLIFRQVQAETGDLRIDHSLRRCRSHLPPGNALICDDQPLINEVNPDIDDVDPLGK